MSEIKEYEMNLNDVPEWLKDKLPPLNAAKENLIASRTEMYKTLELYHIHVKYVITMMFTLLTALFAIVGLIGKLEQQVISLEGIRTMVGIFLCVVFLLGLVAIVIIRRYYEVYVSALVFAVRVHMAAEVMSCHPWFMRTVEQAKKWQSKVDSDHAFLRWRSLSPHDSFCLYAVVIGILSLLSLIYGVSIVWVELKPWLMLFCF